MQRTGKVNIFSYKSFLAVSPKTVKLLGMPGLVWLHANKWDLLIHNSKRVQLFKVEHQKCRQSNSAANYDRLLLLICQFPAPKHALMYWHNLWGEHFFSAQVKGTRQCSVILLRGVGNIIRINKVICW